MKRFICIATLATLFSLTTKAVAQTTVFGGEVISPVNMSHMEAAKFSQTEHTYLSARVAAMGGAFTSLGADLSSMTINPAGLGMYRSSVLSVSAAYDHTRSSNGNVGYGVNKGNFSFNQIGTALNLYQGSGSLVSFTLGFAYNKLADLNYRNSARWDNGEVTIGEFFAEQMYGIDPSELSPSKAPFSNPDIYPDEWGGVLAYRTFFINPVMDENSGLFTGGYDVTGVPIENRVNSHLAVESMGSVGEYDLSAGFNFGNLLYVGATLGIQSIEQIIYYDYSEKYVGASGDTELSSMLYRPTIANYGSGINFKIGAILRPIPAVRFGVAYHTSTSVEIIRDYQTSMYTLFGNGDAYGEESLINSFGLNYSSPNKLLLGASVQLGEKALLSVDYDMVWYDNISFHTGYTNINEAMNRSVDLDLGKANNLRVGLEMRPISRLYLRGGYALYGSPFNDEVTKLVKEGEPFYGNYKTTTENYSLGLGWRFAGGSMLDVAWIKSTANYTNHYLYQYYTDNVAEGSDPILVQSPEIKNNKLRRTTITATYTLLF